MKLETGKLRSQLSKSWLFKKLNHVYRPLVSRSESEEVKMRETQATKISMK